MGLADPPRYGGAVPEDRDDDGPQRSVMSGLRERALGLGESLTARRRRPAIDQRLVLAASAVVFILATVLAARSLPPLEGDVRWGFFVAVGLLGAPTRIWLTGEEFNVLARLTNRKVSRPERIRVALIGAAANLLPLPGSVLVRAEVLRRRGASLGSIGRATATMAAMWAGTTALVAGSLLAALSERRLLGLAGAACGVAICAGATAVILRRRHLYRRGRVAAFLFAIEATFIFFGGIRMWAVMYGLGFSVGIEQATALTVAGLVTNAVGFAPAGLGIRELTTAAISPIVGLPASVGLLTAALMRLIDLTVLGPASAVLMLWRDRSPRGGQPSEDANGQTTLAAATSAVDVESMGSTEG